MLYRAVIGPEHFTHPELQAFKRGFQLPCRNGFNFPEVCTFCQTLYIADDLQAARSWTGGSEGLLTTIWTSHISSYAALKDHLSIFEPRSSYQTELRLTLGDPSATFTSLLVGFLQGSGVPCPRLFEDATIHFSSLVDLGLVDEIGFRAKMFCWAASGSYEREMDAPQINVRPTFFRICLLLVC